MRSLQLQPSTSALRNFSPQLGHFFWKFSKQEWQGSSAWQKLAQFSLCFFGHFAAPHSTTSLQDTLQHRASTGDALVIVVGHAGRYVKLPSVRGACGEMWA